MRVRNETEAPIGAGASGGAARQPNSAPTPDRLAAAVAALLILRKKSVVADGVEVSETLRELTAALKLKYEAVADAVYNALAKYRVYKDESSELYIFVDGYDITRDVDRYMIWLIYFYEADAAIDEYLVKKLSTEDERWSAAFEALRLAGEAEFEIKERLIDDERMEYRITAPTGETFIIMKYVGKVIDYSFEEP